MTCVRNDHFTKQLGKFIQKINCQVSSLWLRGFTFLSVLIVGIISKAIEGRDPKYQPLSCLYQDEGLLQVGSPSLGFII